MDLLEPGGTRRPAESFAGENACKDSVRKLAQTSVPTFQTPTADALMTGEGSLQMLQGEKDLERSQ